VEIFKYIDLIREIQRMWKVKAQAAPAIIGTTRTI
jgi:hypothetical protein